MPDIDTHGLRVDFGKYRGERYTRLPVSYLRWMVNDSHQKSDVARAELERRGIPLNDTVVEISGHAIDQASKRVLKIWRKERSSGEGLHHWLVRISEKALANTKGLDKNGRTYHMGMKLVFAQGELYFTLKTIMRDDRK